VPAQALLEPTPAQAAQKNAKSATADKRLERFRGGALFLLSLAVGTKNFELKKMGLTVLSSPVETLFRKNRVFARARGFVASLSLTVARIARFMRTHSFLSGLVTRCCQLRMALLRLGLALLKLECVQGFPQTANSELFSIFF
jgi:hypothetical protein